MKALLWASLVVFGAPSGAAGSPPQDPPPDKRTSAPYVPGTTTRAAAEAHWTATGATIGASGHLALGTGSGMDDQSEAYDENVELVDVSGVDFEGLPDARFGFYKGTLYVVQAELKRVPFLGMKPAAYTQEELDALKEQLRKRHGPPAVSRKTIFAAGKTDEFVWQIGVNRLILTKNAFGPRLVLVNERMEAQIQRDRTTVCKKFNTKERIVCW